MKKWTERELIEAGYTIQNAKINYVDERSQIVGQMNLMDFLQ